MTRNEADLALGHGRPNFNASRRLIELERMGIARRGAKRTCRVTGRQCEEWFAVVGVPNKSAARKVSHKDRLRSKVQEIEEALAGPGGLMPDPRIDRLRQLVKEAKEIAA